MGKLSAVILVSLALATAGAGVPTADEINGLIGRGLNVGNALEAPNEGDWGITIKEDYFDLIKSAGFNSIRIPVCWSAHARMEKPFTISPGFFQRTDQVLRQALHRQLIVILTMHHYNELYQYPSAHRERFLAIWQQIAERYRDYPFQLLFEPLNEPHDRLKADEWNPLLRDVLAVIRLSNPTRKIVFGPVNYNDIHQLEALELPPDDRDLIVSVHYYLPYQFTHQGTHWAPGSEAWLGTKWNGTEEEKRMITQDFDGAAAWAKKNRRPIFIGEFGANSKADLDSRARWTKFVADTAIERGFRFTYWDFCAEYFGLYDLNRNSFRKPLLEAVIPPGIR